MEKGKGRSKGGDIPRSGGIEVLNEAQTLRSLTTSMRAWTALPIKGKSSIGRADQSTSLSPIFSLLDLENDFSGKKREKIKSTLIFSKQQNGTYILIYGLGRDAIFIIYP